MGGEYRIQNLEYRIGEQESRMPGIDDLHYFSFCGIIV